MGHEDQDADKVEDTPVRVLEDLVLQLVDVPDCNGFHRLVLGPEQVEGQDACEVDQIAGWADPVGIGVTESELEQVDGHEAHQSNSCYCQVELARLDAEVELQIPGALEANKDVQNGCKQNVFLNDVCRQSKSCPVEADVEIAVSIEIIRTHEHME